MKSVERGGGHSVIPCFDASVFRYISSSTLYGVTNLVTEVTKPVTHEESLTPTSSEKQKVESRKQKSATLSAFELLTKWAERVDFWRWTNRSSFRLMGCSICIRL